MTQFRNKVDPAFGQWLGPILKANRLTQKEVWEKAGVSRPALQSILSARRGASPKMVGKICQAVNSLAGKEVARIEEGLKLLAPRRSYPERLPAYKGFDHYTNKDEFAVYLVKMMKEYDLNIPILSEESGIPATTIYRFLHSQQQMRIATRLAVNQALTRLVAKAKGERYYEKAKPGSSAK